MSGRLADASPAQPVKREHSATLIDRATGCSIGAAPSLPTVKYYHQGADNFHGGLLYPVRHTVEPLVGGASSGVASNLGQYITPLVKHCRFVRRDRSRAATDSSC